MQIYSIVDGVVNVHVKCCPNPSEFLNEFFCKTTIYAKYTEEDFISKTNHSERRNLQSFHAFDQSAESNENLFELATVQYINEKYLVDIDPPPPVLANKCVKLNGPYNPLAVDLCGISEATKNRLVAIDRHSINTILLDDGDEESVRTNIKCFFLEKFCFNFSFLYLNYRYYRMHMKNM